MFPHSRVKGPANERLVIGEASRYSRKGVFSLKREGRNYGEKVCGMETGGLLSRGNRLASKKGP